METPRPGRVGDRRHGPAPAGVGRPPRDEERPKEAASPSEDRSPASRVDPDALAEQDSPPGDEEQASEGEEQEPPEKRGPFHFLRELPGLILIALALALLIKTFLIQAFFIPSQSMEPTLQVGDRVIVNKIVYRFRDPNRGEVVVFENPNHVDPDRNPLSAFWNWITEGLGFSTDPTKDFIKRVIALPGETIEVADGRILIDGEPLEEPYLNRIRDRTDFGPQKVPPDHYFMMGDNRANSQDSRIFGAIPREKVVGKAFIILWPPSRFSWLSAG